MRGRSLFAALRCVSLVGGVLALRTASPSAANAKPSTLGALLILAIGAGAVLADEKGATVVSYDKETMKLVVKEGEKERTVQLKKTTHVHYPEGNRIKEVKLAERPDYLKKGVKVVIEEEDGKLIEINIKK